MQTVYFYINVLNDDVKTQLIIGILLILFPLVSFVACLARWFKFVRYSVRKVGRILHGTQVITSQNLQYLNFSIVIGLSNIIME